MPLPLLAFAHCTVRYLNRVLFADLSFRLEPGQHWALLGPSGAGKSTLLATLAGRYVVTGGTATYPLLAAPGADDLANPLFSWRKRVALVGPQATFRASNHHGQLYYQQRYNAAAAQEVPTVREYLRAVPALAAAPWTYERVVEVLRLGSLQGERLIKLSNGETQRLRLAAALLRNPRLLLLDAPLSGLDAATRAWFDAFLAEVAASGITVIMATAPAEIPALITHVAVLAGQRITKTLPRAAFWPEQLPSAAAPAPLDADELRALASAAGPGRYDTLICLR
ncbi:MAG: ATP-binding cassette domain-containing protein, partial [Cytophagaceae bacterium]